MIFLWISIFRRDEDLARTRQIWSVQWFGINNRKMALQSNTIFALWGHNISKWILLYENFRKKLEIFMNFRNFGKTVSFSKHPVFYYLYLAPVKAYSEIGKMRPPTLDMNRKLNLVCAWVISKFWNFGVIIFRCKTEFAKSNKKCF